MSEPATDLPIAAETARSEGKGPVVFAMTGAAGATGGIAASNLNVLHALVSLSQESGRALIVLSLHEASGDRPSFLESQVKFIGFRGSKWAYALKLTTLFRRDGVVIFDHVRLALPLCPMVALGFRDFVIMAHGSESWRRVRWLSKWLFRRARLCLANSRFTLMKMQETFSGFVGRACALGLSPAHAGVDATPGAGQGGVSLRAVDGEDRMLGSRVILLVGRMDRGEREKGHYELLAIWPDIVRDFPDAQLVFAGPGNDRATLVERARQLEAAASIFAPGYLPTETLRELYGLCYAFVMPSRQEGFGLVYLEAMSCAKPCVGCRNGGGEEVIQDRVSGLLIDNPFGNDELLDAVRRLLVDEATATRLGREGLRRLDEHFTPAHAQARLRRLLAPMMRCG